MRRKLTLAPIVRTFQMYAHVRELCKFLLITMFLRISQNSCIVIIWFSTPLVILTESSKKNKNNVISFTTSKRENYNTINKSKMDGEQKDNYILLYYNC